jgi:hypothetical protein
MDLYMKKYELVFMICLSFFVSRNVFARPFPLVSGPFKLSFTEDKFDYPDEFPRGAYQLPQTDVFVSKLNGNEDLETTQLLFGALASGVQTDQMAGNAKKMVQNEEAVIGIDVQAMAKRCLQTRIENSGDKKNFVFFETFDKNSIRITPRIVFSFVDEFKARLWAVISVRWKDPATGAEWHSQYISGLGAPRSMTGFSGWTANRAKALYECINLNTETAFWAMLADIDGKMRSTKLLETKLNGQWIFLRNPKVINAQPLISGKDWDAVLPLVDDESLFSGIFILPKDFNVPVTP